MIVGKCIVVHVLSHVFYVAVELVEVYVTIFRVHIVSALGKVPQHFGDAMRDVVEDGTITTTFVIFACTF